MNAEHIKLFQELLPYLKWAAIGFAGLYVVAAFGINVLAAKLRQSLAWLAWIPIANLFLLCRMAQSTLLLVIFALIPVVNLLVLGYLGARIARRLDKSGVLGAMFGIPILGAFVPLLLSGGDAPDLPADAKPASMSPFASAALTAGAMLALVAALGGAYGYVNHITKDVAPTTEQVVADLPERVAGTLTEFPIDTDKANPARPAKVVTQSFGAAKSANDAPGGGHVKTDQLPPWIPAEALPKIANDATSADYYSGSAGSPVSVMSLSLRDGESDALKPPTAKDLVRFGLNAVVTGINLISADGATYTGYKVTTDDAAFYMLQKVASNIAVLISANGADALEVAARLASNVGNGEGLLEFESYRDIFGRLPSAPAGSALSSSMTFTSDDIGHILGEMAESANSGDSGLAQAGDLINLVKNAAPNTASLAQYGRPGEQRFYMSGVAGYTSASESWMVFQTLPRLVQAVSAAASSSGVSFRIRSITVHGAQAYAVDADNPNGGEKDHAGAILLRQGGSLVALTSMGSSSDDLVPWADSYLSGK